MARVACDCAVGSHPTLGDRGRCQELRALRSDFSALGEAFVGLYLQHLNGVICDPDDDCRPCSEAWAKGKAAVEKYDSAWGNLHREGASFQPGWDSGAQGS
jgi:hypothetical protein